jgi:hypothetical protein
MLAKSTKESRQSDRKQGKYPLSSLSQNWKVPLFQEEDEKDAGVGCQNLSCCDQSKRWAADVCV